MSVHGVHRSPVSRFPDDHPNPRWSHHHGPTMRGMNDQWEYTVKTVPTQGNNTPGYGEGLLEDAANELGQDGWEMVGFQVGMNGGFYTCVYKRRIED